MAVLTIINFYQSQASVGMIKGHQFLRQNSFWGKQAQHRVKDIPDASVK